MIKTCRTCNISKDITEFYVHKQMADGHLNECKTCQSNKSKIRYRANVEARKIYERKRNATPERKAQKLKYLRKTRQLDKGKARVLVGNAVRDGRLLKLSCEVCGDTKSEGHHDDYRKPLKVRWLCFKHHRAVHGQSL